MASGSDDDLSRTATQVPVRASDATVPASGDPATSQPAPESIGRYRLERELGQGGMGVVYVAFDPDLERRIALKVLRAATSREAAQRLQREARAMARLNHPNVVTVHEVGTASGRDFVAMELIDGDTLADWVRTQQPTERDIVIAFVQAGRGLAAAHAAGIVHRDFKPHNVLRDRHGHIEVTDFGLAREAHAEVASGDPLAVTLPVSATTSLSTSSMLAGLTVTGSLLGTPAYMAPEQWTGGVVSPATDQFAYCVALWEALTGARPFVGPTVDLLRAQILEGAHELTPSVLPRRLRAPLMRGLDPDPKKRWPSMDALLAAIEPRPRSLKGLAIALIVSGGAVLVLVGILGGAPSDSAIAACPPPLLALDAAWSQAKRAQLVAAGKTLAIAALDADAQAWSAARAHACAADVVTRPALLSCLDGVLGRFDAAVGAAASIQTPRQLDVGSALVDPRVCDVAKPPRLLVPSPFVREALAVQIRMDSRLDDVKLPELDALATKVTADSCASMYVHMMRSSLATDGSARQSAAELAEQGAERCDDERARADGALQSLATELKNQYATASVQKKLRQAEVAIAPVTQADLRAQIEAARTDIESRVENLPQAIERADAAIMAFAERGRIHSELSLGLLAVVLRQLRGTPEDVVEVARRLTTLRTRAVAALGADDDMVRSIEQTEAYWSFMLGDVAGAHARLAAVQKSGPIEGAIAASGKVVDARGAPVAGATVIVGHLTGDAISISLSAPENARKIRTTTTAADGTFSFPEALPDGVVVAQLGDRRSVGYRVGTGLTLKLRATSHVEGKVDLQGLPSVRALVAFISQDQPQEVRYSTVAPLAPDGSFAVDGVPRGKHHAVAVVSGVLGNSVTSVEVTVDKPVVRGIAMKAPAATRTVYVVLRSQVGQPIANAQIVLQGGRVTATTLKGLRALTGARSVRLALPILGDAVPAEVRAVARDGDLYATLTEVPAGIATSCAFALPSDLNDRRLQDVVDRNLDKIGTTCTPIAETAKVLVQEVPPWPRIE